MATDNSQISRQSFLCSHCNIKCFRKTEWDRHVLTRKHIVNKNGENGIIHKCNCGKIYKDRSGLWKHKKSCNKLNCDVNENIVIDNNPGHEENENNESDETVVMDASRNEMKLLTSLVIEIFKSNNELKQQNLDFQKQMLELYKNNNNNINPNTVNNANTLNANTTNNMINANNNNNNKTFNLNFFLNEQCKNAMNLKDFVDSMEVTLEDAEKFGDEGYVEGMSSLLIRKINETDVFLRPIHCSDSKRDITHIKRNDKWERDGNNEHLTMAIKYVEQKNMIALDQFGEKYPDWRDSDSPHNDKYLNMMIKLTDSGTEEYKKVAKRIIKAVIIDKENV